MNAKLKVQLVWSLVLMGLGAVVLICTTLVSTNGGDNYTPLPVIIMVLGLAILLTWTNTMLNIAESEAKAAKTEAEADAEATEPAEPAPLGGPGAAESLS